MITNGFPDVSTHVHSFHEQREALVCGTQARCTTQVAFLRRVDQGQEQSNWFPFVLQARGSPESNQDFVSARSQRITVKTKGHKNCKADMHRKPFLKSSSRQEPSTKKKMQGARLEKLTTSASSEEAENRISVDHYIYRLGVPDGETPAKEIPRVFGAAGRGGMVSALVKQHHAHMSKLHEQETT